MRIEIGKFDIQTAGTLFFGDADLPLMRFIIAPCCHEEDDASGDLGFPSSLKALALVKIYLNV